MLLLLADEFISSLGSEADSEDEVLLNGQSYELLLFLVFLVYLVSLVCLDVLSYYLLSVNHKKNNNSFFRLPLVSMSLQNVDNYGF